MAIFEMTSDELRGLPNPPSGPNASKHAATASACFSITHARMTQSYRHHPGVIFKIQDSVTARFLEEEFGVSTRDLQKT